MAIRMRQSASSIRKPQSSDGIRPKTDDNSLEAVIASALVALGPRNNACYTPKQTADVPVRRIATRDNVIESPFERAALGVDVDVKPLRDDTHEIRHLRSIAKVLDERVEALQEKWDDEDGFDVDDISPLEEMGAEAMSAMLDEFSHSNSAPAPVTVGGQHPGPNRSPEKNHVQEHSYLDYIYSGADDLFIHKLTGRTFCPRAFERMFKPILPTRNVDELLTTAEFYDNIYAGLRLVPGAGHTVDIDGMRLFNIYRGADFLAVRGDIAPFDGFVEHLFQGMAPQAEIFLDCLAWIYQNLGKRLGYLLVFCTPSMENTVVLSGLMEVLNGKSNTVYADSSMLAYPHNDWMLSAKLIILQRLSSSKPAMEKVGSLINSPQQWINPKRSDQYSIQSVANVVSFVQKIDTLSAFPHPSQIALLSLNDKALSALRTTEFRDWFDGDGKAYVLEALLSRDVSHFTPLSPPLGLLLAKGQAAMTLSPVEDYLQEALDADIAPMACELVNINRVVDYLNDEKMLRTNATEVRNALNNMGAVNIGQKRINGKKPNIWALDNYEQWKNASEALIASTYVDPFAQNNRSNKVPTSTIMSGKVIPSLDRPQPRIPGLDDL